MGRRKLLGLRRQTGEVLILRQTKTAGIAGRMYLKCLEIHLRFAIVLEKAYSKAIWGKGAEGERRRIGEQGGEQRLGCSDGHVKATRFDRHLDKEFLGVQTYGYYIIGRFPFHTVRKVIQNNT